MGKRSRRPLGTQDQSMLAGWALKRTYVGRVEELSWLGHLYRLSFSFSLRWVVTASGDQGGGLHEWSWPALSTSAVVTSVVGFRWNWSSQPPLPQQVVRYRNIEARIVTRSSLQKKPEAWTLCEISWILFWSTFKGERKAKPNKNTICMPGLAQEPLGCNLYQWERRVKPWK